MSDPASTSPAASADATRELSTLSIEAHDAARPAAPSNEPDRLVPALGQDLGPVRLMSELGRGAAGVVFLGQHKLLGRAVAVKCLIGAYGALGDSSPRRFVEEARAAAAVQHPNLTQIYHADVAGDVPFLVMEYIDGPTLGRLLADAGPLEPAVVLGLMSEVADAVGELHDRGLIHRDLKPNNVLLDREGRARVSDFGLALRRTTLASVSTASPQLAGTPAYMAPEMFDGRVSPRSDIYAMGLMMCQMLTGALPFNGSLDELRRQHQSAPLPLDALRDAGADDGLLDLLERATHKQFLFRYKTAHELGRAIKSLGGDAGRSRRELAKLILQQQEGREAAGPDGTSSSTLDRTPSPKPDGTYAETIGRLASAKRERRSTITYATPTLILPPAPIDNYVPPASLHLDVAPSGAGSAADSDRSPSAPAPAASEPAGAQRSLEFHQWSALSSGPVTLPGRRSSTTISPAAPARAPASARKLIEYRPSRRRVPGALVALCIVGVAISLLSAVGALACILYLTIPEVADMAAHVRLFGVAAVCANALLVATLFVGSIAGLRGRAWARPTLLIYAWAELGYQLLTTAVTAFLTIPYFVQLLRAHSTFASPAEANHILGLFRLALTLPLGLRWIAVSAFALTTIWVLHRPRVRRALTAPKTLDGAV